MIGFNCYCIGPQNGEPLCPCQMRNVSHKDGRYILPAKDLGPASEQPYPHKQVADYFAKQKQEIPAKSFLEAIPNHERFVFWVMP